MRLILSCVFRLTAHLVTSRSQEKRRRGYSARRCGLHSRRNPESGRRGTFGARHRQHHMASLSRRGFRICRNVIPISVPVPWDEPLNNGGKSRGRRRQGPRAESDRLNRNVTFSSVLGSWKIAGILVLSVRKAPWKEFRRNHEEFELIGPTCHFDSSLVCWRHREYDTEITDRRSSKHGIFESDERKA